MHACMLTELRKSAVSLSKEDGELIKDWWSLGWTPLHSTSKAHLPVKLVPSDVWIYSLIISNWPLAKLSENTWCLIEPSESVEWIYLSILFVHKSFVVKNQLQFRLCRLITSCPQSYGKSSVNNYHKHLAINSYTGFYHLKSVA